MVEQPREQTNEVQEGQSPELRKSGFGFLLGGAHRVGERRRR